MTSTEPLEAIVDQAMPGQQHRFRRQLRDLQRRMQSGKSADQQLQQLADRIRQSIQLRQRRHAERPQITLDPDLPITAKADEIATALADHPVIIVCGDTGSGKSTQLPKICLREGRGLDGIIGHTQPRRLAARSVSTRLAEELGRPLGHAVGYKIRFTDHTRPETYVKLMTDGILLAETQHDRFLNQYDTIIVDEAHERSLNIDFLLGYLKQLLPKRPELRCIITSATIDAARFSQHFASPRLGPAPVIEVSGRMYPVELRYRPPTEEGDDADPNLQQAISTAVDELVRETRGDVLVFLPTEREIRETAKTLRGMSTAQGKRLEILPLYARLPAKEQHRIFASHSQPRVVLATNVAESSLTVPGICAVVDTGTARISRYSPRSKVQRLPIEPVSRASADQRKGRCGRLGPGICIRLYGEQDYLSRDQYTTPEIRRTNLAAVILQTIAYRLGPIEEFPFLDPPRIDAVRDGYKTLYELGAIDEQQQLTDIGRQLSRMPVDPRIGRMILAADENQCLGEVLIIAAALEVQDPRDRPIEKQQAADEQHARFQDPTSDFISYLRLWDFYHQLKQDLSRNQLQKACRQSFLSLNRLREWADVHRQLHQLAGESGRTIARRRDDYDAIHKALLSGLLAGVAFRSDTFEYTGAGGIKLHLWPGSGLFETKPKWIMAAELVETTRRFGRVVARIDPAWIETIGKHLLQFSYSDPQWNPRSALAMVNQRVSLFGLPVVSGRRVPLGPVDPATARQLFIEYALVEEQMVERFAFLRHNQQVRQDVESLAAKTRRGDWVVSPGDVFRFYDQRLPDDVWDPKRLQNWLKSKHADPQALQMQRGDLLPDADVDDRMFPDEFSVRQMQLPLEYRFQPGSDDDGVTIRVPRQALNQLHSEQLEWLVPAHLEEKVTALIRSLPKSIRRGLVPAPDTARRAVALLEHGQQAFLTAVAQALEKVSGERVPADAFQLEKLPPHLRMNIHLVDEQGKTVARERNVDELKRRFASEQGPAPTVVQDTNWHRDTITAWDFGELPEQILIDCGGVQVPAFPTLEDATTSVRLRVYDSADLARESLRAGLRRLFWLAEKNELRSQVAWLPGWDQIQLLAATLMPAKQLQQELAELLADRAFLGNQPWPQNAAQFQRRLSEATSRIGLAVQEVVPLLKPLFDRYHQAQLALEHTDLPRWQDSVQDVRQQLQYLLPARFLLSTPWQWLQHFPRYLHAIAYRLEKLTHGGEARDQQGRQQIEPFWQAYLQRAEQHRQQNKIDPALTEFRWLLEEFRVSLFAQPLGTSVSISAKRLEKHWANVE